MMALDHFVPQVHLRQFCVPPGSKTLFAMRKADLRTYTPSTRNVCAINDGNSNPYLIRPREIEGFLKDIEPKYPAAVKALRTRAIDRDAIYGIAGFISYVIACSPAGARIMSTPFRSVVAAEIEMLDRQGKLPAPPPELGVASASEALREGRIQVEVDGAFAQAIGVSSIIQIARTYGNFHWDILSPDSQHDAFVTSDYPVAIEPGSAPGILNRLIPIAPDVAIRVVPNRGVSPESASEKFDDFSRRFVSLNRSEVRAVNATLVQCADKVVFSTRKSETFRRLVAENGKARIEARTETIKTPSGAILVTQQGVEFAAE